MGQALCVLMVEDSEVDAELLQITLQQGGYTVTTAVVDRPEDMARELEGQAWDIITSDHSMPHFSAPQALALAKKLRPDVPFIILSGEIDLNLAVTLMRDGAQDYIQKHELARVVPAIERELREVVLVRERQQAEAALRASEANLALAQHLAHIGSWEWDMLANTVHWSQEMYRVYGLSPETYDGKPESVLKVVHPEDVPTFLHSMNSNLESGESPALEYRVIHPDGSVHRICATGRVEFDAAGRPVRSVGTVQDISERGEREQAQEQILRLKAELDLQRADRSARLGAAIQELEARAEERSARLAAAVQELRDLAARASEPDVARRLEQLAAGLSELE